MPASAVRQLPATTDASIKLKIRHQHHSVLQRLSVCSSYIVCDLQVGQAKASMALFADKPLLVYLLVSDSPAVLLQHLPQCHTGLSKALIAVDIEKRLYCAVCPDHSCLREAHEST